MEIHYIGLFFISLIALTTSEVKLTVDNAEPKAGASATFTCTVTGMTPLDYMRFVRRIDGTDYEISTNAYMSDPFKSSGRYKVTESQPTFTLVISDVQGQDSGDIGCVLQKQPNPESKYLNFDVKVAPKSVEIMQYKDGSYLPITGDTVALQQNKESGFACKVTMEDSDTKPTLSMRYGDMQLTPDMQGVEFPESTPVVTSAEGYQKITNVVQGNYVTSTAQPSDDGKTVSCTASTPDFDDVTKTATVSVLYEPAFMCDTSATVRVGQAGYTLSCTAIMNPPPTASFWSWITDGAQTEIKTGDTTEEFAASQEETPDGKYKFLLTFTKTDPEDFHDYKLTVVNPVGMAHQSFTLEERQVTTASPEDIEGTVEPTTAAATTTTKKEEAVEKSVNPTYKVNTNDGGNSATMVTVSLLLPVAIVTKLICDAL